MAEERSTTRNAASARQNREAAKLERLAREKELANRRIVMSTYAGREETWERMQECHVFTPIMTTSPHIFERAGRHDWGLKLLADTQDADPKLFFQMWQEALDRKKIAIEPGTIKADGVTEEESDD